MFFVFLFFALLFLFFTFCFFVLYFLHFFFYHWRNKHRVFRFYLCGKESSNNCVAWLWKKRVNDKFGVYFCQPLTLDLIYLRIRNAMLIINTYCWNIEYFCPVHEEWLKICNYYLWLVFEKRNWIL